MPLIISSISLIFALLIVHLTDSISLPFKDILVSVPFAFLLAFSYQKFSFLKEKKWDKKKSYFTIFLILLIIIALIDNHRIFDDWLDGKYFNGVKRYDYLFLPEYLLLSIILSFLAYKLELIIISKKITFLFLLLAFILLAYQSLFIILSEYSPYLINALNFSIVLMPIINVFYGVFPPADAQSQYGHYAYFFLPFLKIFGISITSITSFFYVAMIISFYSIFLTTFIFTKKYFLSFSVLVLSFFLSTSFSNTWPAELYYQFNPVRTLVPCLSVLVVFYAIKFDNTKFDLMVLFIFCLMTFWNFESGIPTILSILFLYFLKFFFNAISQKKYFEYSCKFLLYCFFIFISFISVVFLFELITRKELNFYDLFQPLIVWGVDYKLIAMSKIHTNKNLMFDFNDSMFYFYLIFLTTFSYSILCLFKNTKTNKNKKINDYLFLSFLSILTIGLSTYGLNKFSAPRSVFLLPMLLAIFYNISYENITISNKIKIKSKLRSLNYFYNFVILFIFIHLTVFYFVDITKRSEFIHTPNFLEVYFPSEENTKSLWDYKGESSTSVNFFRIKDLYHNPSVKPPWIKRSDWFKEFYDSKIILPEHKVLVISEHDYLINLKMERGLSTKLANWQHVFVYKHQLNIINQIRNNYFDWILFDESFITMKPEGGDFIDIIFNNIYKNYRVFSRASLTYDWYGYWKPTQQVLYKRK